MRELSLFTGAGGGLLGGHLLGWSPIGYVEYNEYCQRVIAARIRDGILPEAPIFGDIRAFLDHGYARAYTGMVDVLSAGFPCQWVSASGQVHGSDAENRWPETRRAIDVVNPRAVLLENVERLVQSGYIAKIVNDLAALGYLGCYDVLPACDFGGDHFRPRAWIAAYADGERLERLSKIRNLDAARQRVGARCSAPRAINQTTRLQRFNEPAFLGKNDDVADRMDRLKAVGNGQFPRVVTAAANMIHAKLKLISGAERHEN